MQVGIKLVGLANLEKGLCRFWKMGEMNKFRNKVARSKCGRAVEEEVA